MGFPMETKNAFTQSMKCSSEILFLKRGLMEEMLNYQLKLKY